jgi:hypothetical protein
MAYNAGIQMYGSRKPLNPVQPVQNTPKKRNMKERLKKLIAKKDFLDKKTIAYLERMGYINTNI